MTKVTAVISTIAAVYLLVAGSCVLLYWSNTQASWSSSAAGAAINGVLQWFTAAGNWMIQTLW